MTHHLIHKFLNGIVITDVNGIQIDGEVDVHPHVVVTLHMVVKTLKACTIILNFSKLPRQPLQRQMS